MRWLLFLSRLAFICGFFFLLSFSMLFGDWLKEGTLQSTIITIGVFMGLLIIPVTILCYLVVFIIKRKLRAYIPTWLIIANIIFLFVLIYYLFFLNDKNYNPA